LQIYNSIDDFLCWFSWLIYFFIFCEFNYQLFLGIQVWLSEFNLIFIIDVTSPSDIISDYLRDCFEFDKRYILLLIYSLELSGATLSPYYYLISISLCAILLLKLFFYSLCVVGRSESFFYFLEKFKLFVVGCFFGSSNVELVNNVFLQFFPFIVDLLLFALI
jgi:hypothetical protein